jgi:hypothetical protein
LPFVATSPFFRCFIMLSCWLTCLIQRREVISGQTVAYHRFG